MTGQGSYPVFPLEIAAFLRDTQRLSGEEGGVYLHLLMGMWADGGTLPDDDAVLAQVAKVSPRRWKKLAGKIRPYFLCGGGVLWQKRLHFELGKVSRIVAERRSSAALGGRVRALKAQRNPDGTFRDTGVTPSSYSTSYSTSPHPAGHQPIKKERLESSLAAAREKTPPIGPGLKARLDAWKNQRDEEGGA